MAGDAPTQVKVLTEEEATRGWSFDVSLGGGDVERVLRVRLDWADYEHWSRGRAAPSEVVQAVIAGAASIIGAEAIPSRCDAATLRRLATGLDEAVSRFLPR